jgi:Asp-tRNA(Asn)/Glu-tRNA(Gln) amidotransferase A subunit family amidase
MQGSPLFVGCRTGRDAASVAALREAGAVILGKVVTTEFAASEPRGTRNPWDRERTPGGSSSGSAAAVACGMVPAALGTQVVGSILRPASFCGCVGFKPSVGRINRGGSYDYFSQSCTGVLAASLEDAWLVAVNIAARAGGDPGYPGLQGPAEPPAPRRPRTLAVLQTSGWGEAAPLPADPWEQDGPLVATLRRQLGVIMGKTHTVEFAFGGTGRNSHHGAPYNPWDAAAHRSVGGSSSGASHGPKPRDRGAQHPAPVAAVARRRGRANLPLPTCHAGRAPP